MIKAQKTKKVSSTLEYPLDPYGRHMGAEHTTDMKQIPFVLTTTATSKETPLCSSMAHFGNISDPDDPGYTFIIFTS